METKKQEVIRKAWLEFLSEEDFNKLTLDEGGFSNYQCRRYINQFRWNELYSRFRSTGAPKNGCDIIYRPKSLTGIETNNGWIAIDMDKLTLPIDGTEVHFYHCFFNENGEQSEYHKGIFNAALGFTSYYDSEHYKIREVTHYQPIIKPLPPIY